MSEQESMRRSLSTNFKTAHNMKNKGRGHIMEHIAYLQKSVVLEKEMVDKNRIYSHISKKFYFTPLGRKYKARLKWHLIELGCFQKVYGSKTNITMNSRNIVEKWTESEPLPLDWNEYAMVKGRKSRPEKVTMPS